MEVTTPIITTLIPTYRRPKLLRRAIVSALNQTYRNLQVCVYDNASGDETAEVVAELARNDPRVKYYSHPENIGMLPNFNFAWNSVETPYFSLLCDDDVLLPDFYEKALIQLEKYPAAIFATSPVVALTGEGKVNSAPLPTYTAKDPAYFSAPQGLYQLIEGEHPLKYHLLTSYLFRREILNVFSQLGPPVIGFDIDLVIRTAACNSVVIMGQPGGIYVEHSTSNSAQNLLTCLLREFPEIIDKFKTDVQIPEDVRQHTQQVLLNYYGRLSFIWSVKFLLEREFDKSYQLSCSLENYYQRKRQTLLLKPLIMACRKLPVLTKPLNWLYQLRLLPSRGKIQNFQTEYSYLAKYLELPD